MIVLFFCTSFIHLKYAMKTPRFCWEPRCDSWILRLGTFDSLAKGGDEGRVQGEGGKELQQPVPFFLVRRGDVLCCMIIINLGYRQVYYTSTFRTISDIGQYLHCSFSERQTSQHIFALHGPFDITTILIGGDQDNSLVSAYIFTPSVVGGTLSVVDNIHAYKAYNKTRAHAYTGNTHRGTRAYLKRRGSSQSDCTDYDASFIKVFLFNYTKKSLPVYSKTRLSEIRTYFEFTSNLRLLSQFEQGVSNNGSVQLTAFGMITMSALRSPADSSR